MKKNHDKRNQIVDWIVVILIVGCLGLYKLVPTVKKLSSLDRDGLIFVTAGALIIIMAILVSKAYEKKRVRKKAEELNSDFGLDEKRFDEAMAKCGYDKKIGKTIIEDLTKRYRKKAKLPAAVTILFLVMGILELFDGRYGRGAALLCGMLMFLMFTIYALRAEPVRIFRQKFNVTSKIPLAEEDYAEGKLICSGTSGINVGKKLFVVCFTSKYVLIFPIGYIKRATRCVTYKTEYNRGFLGRKKLDHTLKLNIRQPSTERDRVYDLELEIPLDKQRLEIAYNALAEQGVPCEREYEYTEKK